MSSKQRVGSFRSRLKKQQPIVMSEPPMGTTVSPATQEATATAAMVTMASLDYHPFVAVTVHPVDPNQEICDL